ncbi:MAG: AI-2E family transporter [Caldilineales bacterium]|nr:AI-2E family transporter [Caldilineales bacterium]
MDSRWSSTTKLVILAIVLLVGLWILLQFGQAIPPLLVAAILAYLLKPAVDWLIRQTGWSQGFATAAVIFLALGLLVLAPVLATPGIANIISNVRIDVDALQPLLDRISQETIHIGFIELDGADLSVRLMEGLQSLITPFASSALQIVSSVAASLVWIVFVVVVVFWLLKDSHKLRLWFLGYVPGSQRTEFASLSGEIGRIWDAFFRGELVLGVIVGTLVGVSMTILGLPSAFMLGLIAGIMEFIPTIGPPLAAIPAVLTALFIGSSWLHINPLVLAIIVIGVYLVIFQVEQIYLLPRIVGRRVRLHPGVVFVGTIVGAVQIGLLGVLIAAPVIATSRVLGDYIYRKLLDLDPFPAGSIMAAEERKKGDRLTATPILAILFDLDGTLADTDDMMIEKLAGRLRSLNRLFPGDDPRPFIRHLLILTEGPLNWLLSQLDRLSLDDDVFRFNRWMRETLGMARPEALQLIPNVDVTLTQLHQQYRLGLVTTRGRATAVQFLDHHGLTHLFDTIVAADDVRRLKPHPEPVEKAAANLGLEPDSCLMVGDTTVDVRSAQAAGARSVAVLCGFGAERELRDADLIIPSTTALTNYL